MMAENDMATEREKAFYKSIEPGLEEYSSELKKLAVTSDGTLKFLRLSEVNMLQIPEVYKRLLADRIISLQSSDTKIRMKNKRAAMESPAHSQAVTATTVIDKSVTVGKNKYGSSHLSQITVV